VIAENATANDRRDDVTPALGHWISALGLSDIPGDVLSHAKLCILDSLGCGLYGSRQPWSVIAAEVATAFGGSGASLMGRSINVGAADAALVNGTAIHGFEMDDVHVSSSLHPGAVAIPAALATAEHRGRSGADFLAGVIAGYETGIRLGICAGVSHSTSGFHVTGTVGSVASAAAVARVLGLNAGEAAHSIAIGATQASGLYAARLGAMAKRFHAGRAAQSGVIAGYLAEKGFTGSMAAIEAPFGGFLSTLQGQSDAATILDDLGKRWETAAVGFKVYSACASAHTTVDALDALMKEGLTAETLDHLTVRMSKKGFTNIGWHYVPAEIVSAQMNGYYTAAVKLLDGEAFIDQYQQDRLADPAVLSLITRMKFVHDPELDLGGAAKRHAVKVEARLTTGKTLTTYIEQRLGSAARPVSNEIVVAKFRRLAAAALGADQIEETISLVERLEQESNVTRLAHLLSGA
jgi:aconitate decarboxylase